MKVDMEVQDKGRGGEVMKETDGEMVYLYEDGKTICIIG